MTIFLTYKLRIKYKLRVISEQQPKSKQDKQEEWEGVLFFVVNLMRNFFYMFFSSEVIIIKIFKIYYALIWKDIGKNYKAYSVQCFKQYLVV